MGILANSWVIGIATGIVSGLLVFFVTTFLFDNKRKREYNQHKKEANADVINALKPYIAEQGLPSYEVFCSLIDSTSRKFLVNREDMLAPSQVCEELIREIMCDVYITSEKKKEYAERIAEYKTTNSHNPETTAPEDYYKKLKYKSEKQMLLLHRLLIVFFWILIIYTLGMAILIIVNPELAMRLWYFPAYPPQSYEVNENHLLITGITTGLLILSGIFAITLTNAVTKPTRVMKYIKSILEKRQKKSK